MDERRLMLAVALSFLILLGYRILYPPQPAADMPSPAPAERATPPPASAPPPADLSPAAPIVAAQKEVAAESERRVEVVGRDCVVAFSNRGARLVSWRLERFRDARGAAEEMVQTPRDGPRPLDVETGDVGVDARLRDALFV